MPLLTEETGYDSTSGSYHNGRSSDRGRHGSGLEQVRSIDHIGRTFFTVDFVMSERKLDVRCRYHLVRPQNSGTQTDTVAPSAKSEYRALLDSDGLE